MKHLSRKFVLSMIALIGCLSFMFTPAMDGVNMAAIIGAAVEALR